MLRSAGSNFTPLHRRFWDGLDGGFRFWDCFHLFGFCFSLPFLFWGCFFLVGVVMLGLLSHRHVFVMGRFSVFLMLGCGCFGTTALVVVDSSSLVDLYRAGGD
ncbi:hypothetical protein A2U01_0044485 [Trifolium medium]|uniref:Transmembrane protein n=1 Tax=Trifolium medium TaxID=97028 RepID=A0A392QID1_9FABA|nr:hypothetical protein [Trifolium medium]